MDEIEITEDGLIVREERTTFGESDIAEKLIPWTELGEYEIKWGAGGFIPLPKLFDVQLNNDGGIASVLIRPSDAVSTEMELRPRKAKDDATGTPEVPAIDLDEIKVNSRRNFYQRMREKPDSQPATIRQIICSERELTRVKLNQLIEEAGYEPSGGGVGESLVVLEKVTNEIKREGRGKDQYITWTGKS